MAAISRAEFEDAVNDALDAIPDNLFKAMDNVVIVVEDEPDGRDRHLLGLYEGVPLTSRVSGGPLWPDRIVIYRGPLQRMCVDRDELVHQIAVTVVHEVAHHFGISDKRLHDLGWG